MEEKTYKLLGVEMSYSEFDELLCEQSKGKELRVVDGKVVAEYHVQTQDEYLQQLRENRTPLLEAFDKWEKAVLRGRELDDDSVMSWYQDLLDLKEEAFDNIPKRVQYYL